MISKNDILSMARHVVRRGNDIPDRRLLHPRREWHIGLALAFLIISAGAVWNAQQFRYFGSLESRITGEDSMTVRFNEERATDILEKYKARAEALAAIRAEYEAVAPPALEMPAATESSAEGSLRSE